MPQRTLGPSLASQVGEHTEHVDRAPECIAT
jgi:hypothetical protein